MASVQELKDALEAERGAAAQLAESALQAIDTVTNLASFTLAGLGIVIAILALIGFATVYFGARRLARKVAEVRIKSFIEGEEGERFVHSVIADEVTRQIEQRVFVLVQPDAQKHDGPSFPEDPKPKKGG